MLRLLLLPFLLLFSLFTLPPLANEPVLVGGDAAPPKSPGAPKSPGPDLVRRRSTSTSPEVEKKELAPVAAETTSTLSGPSSKTLGLSGSSSKKLE
jgi:hypothetical protein